MEQLQQLIAQLEEENRYLRGLLEKHGIPYHDPKPQYQQTDHPHQGQILPFTITPEMAQFFYSVFRGRRDVYSKRSNRKDGGSIYYPVCDNFWKYGVCPKAEGKQIKCGKCKYQQYTPLRLRALMDHLAGKREDCTDVIGIYPLLPDDTCNFLVFDFDNHEKGQDGPNTDDAWIGEVNALREICCMHDLDVLVERSRSGKGAHIWMFFEAPIPAETARKFASTLLTKGAESVNQTSFKSYDRMLPLQDHLPEGGVGNLIALPLQGKALKHGNSAFIDENWIPYPDQWAVLKRIKRIPAQYVEERIQEWAKETGELGELAGTYSETEQNTEKPWVKKQSGFHAADAAGPVRIVLADGLYVEKTGLKPRLQNQIRRLAAYSNPQFYRNRAMGYSVYNTPRIVYCGEDIDNYIHIPRGCLESLCERLEDADIPYILHDERTSGTTVKVSFRGELYSEQKEAADQLLRYDTGVLSAATAFGKTAVGAWLIAQRKVNALVLVRNTEIMKNWQEDLEKFLDIQEEPPEYTTPSGRRKKRKSVIGRLQANHNSLTGIIDIAMITSLGKRDQINPIVQDYGLVIMDECHHAGADTDEAVLRQVRARYVYGLTATPKRDDGQEQKIFMQFGPIRYKYTAKDRAKKQGIGHYVYPRFTRLVSTADHRLSAVEANQLVIESSVRNTQIIADVIACVTEGRTPLVMTKYKDHAALLYEKLQNKAEHVFLLQGGRSRKQRDSIRVQMSSVPENESMIVVAIGKYIGEGFNYPRLDTLLLAMPISWQGNVEQYAGRLNRDYEGKRDVVIYDYIDSHIPVLDRMYHKRLRAYKQIGFEICTSPGIEATDTNAIFDSDNYRSIYEQDLLHAEKEIVISSPGLGNRKVKELITLIRERQERGVQITVLTIPPADCEDVVRAHMEESIRLLGAAAITVAQVSGCHEHFAVIDRSLVWYGSMNLLSREKEDDNLIRIQSKTVAEELLELGLFPEQNKDHES